MTSNYDIIILNVNSVLPCNIGHFQVCHCKKDFLDSVLVEKNCFKIPLSHLIVQNR